MANTEIPENKKKFYNENYVYKKLNEEKNKLPFVRRCL